MREHGETKDRGEEKETKKRLNFVKSNKDTNTLFCLSYIFPLFFTQNQHLGKEGEGERETHLFAGLTEMKIVPAPPKYSPLPPNAWIVPLKKKNYNSIRINGRK